MQTKSILVNFEPQKGL